VYSFSKAQRLLTKADYDAVFKDSKKWTTSGFVVLYRKNDLAFARLGLALSKKMIHKAHDRNRVKRLIREGFRRATLPAFDLIFLARTGVAKQTNHELSMQLSKLWIKLASV
jgi:ribonuclease P protein component